MALDFTNYAAGDFLAWSAVRNTLADCISFTVDKAVTGARVYPNWIYEIDHLSLLGKVTAAMKATAGTSLGKVHCWTIGIGEATYVKNAEGVVEYGGNRWDWDLKIDIWGLFENDGTAASQKIAEDEARAVSANIWGNRELILSSTPKWREIRPLEYSALQPTPFSDGTSVIVASGSMPVRLSEQLLQP